MKGLARVAGILLLIASAVQATHLSAQVQPEGWKELLESRTRIAYRFTHPPAPGECGPAQLPASGYLISPAHTQPVGKTWLAGPNRSRWEPIAGPARIDTLKVRVAELWCAQGSRSLLVEADGYYLELDGSQLARVDSNGTLIPGILLADGAAGEPIQVALREMCDGGSCRLTLANAEAYAAEVRLAVLQRQEAELVRSLEAERRAESQAAARVQTGAAVGAQMNAVLNRQLVENYQRLGATPEQANAILQGRVLPGMTQAMVRAAIGEPRETRQERTADTTVTTWIYPGRQVVIERGIVTAVR